MQTKKIFAFLTGLCCSLVIMAQVKQTDTSYRLLWYKGKKIKPNVLLTPMKDTVRFDKTKLQVRVTSKTGNGKELDDMLTELNKTPQRIREMMSRIQAGLPKQVVPFYVNVTKDAFRYIQNELSPLLSNTLQLPAVAFSKTAAPQQGKGPSIISYEPPAETFDEALQRLMAYYEQHKNEKITYVPTPPRREFTYCSMKDKGLDERYERDFEVFQEELVGKDHEMFQLYLNLCRHVEIMFDSAQRAQVLDKVEPLHDMFLSRQYTRALLLVEKFSNDPYRCWAVMKICLLIERTLALVGWHDGDPGWKSVVEMIMQKGMATWAAMFEKAMAEYDYSIALNLQAILGLERMAQIHDLDVKIPLYKLLKFNQFKLNMHVSAKISAEGGYQLAELKGDNWFSAIPDSSGRLYWVLIGPLLHEHSMDLVAAEMRGPVDFPYIGTRKWKSQLPNLKLDFCNEQKDTLEVYMFHAEDFKETWVFPDPTGPIDLLVVSGVLAATFLDVERIKQYKRDIEADPKMIEKMKKDMLAQLEKVKKGMSNLAPNSTSLTNMAGMAEVQKMTNEMLRNSRKMDPLKFVFKPTARNRSAIIVQEKINGKELFPQNTATEYAWFHLKMEQDPSAPYDINL